MGIVRTDNLREDMVLSEDIRDINGRLLLREGLKINATHINIVKKWGVTEVRVVDDDGGSPPISEETDTQKIENSDKIKLFFKHTDLDHPVVKELFRLAALYNDHHHVLNTHPWNTTEPPVSHDQSPRLDVKAKILDKGLKLPELPSIAFELNDILSNPLSTADNLAQVVSKSPSLAAALLKIVNSPFYGFASRIDNISRAITIIGTKEISSLALVLCTLTVFKGIPEYILDMKSFLRHSFACGLVSRMLSAQKNIPKTEQLFAAGLLHDLGRVLVYQYFPEQATSLLNQCIRHGSVLYLEEKTLLGCMHTDISRILLQKWRFPPILEDNIFHHHSPMEAENPIHAAILHLADIIVNAVKIGTSGERFVPPLDHAAWEKLGIPLSCLEMVVRQAMHQLSALEHFLAH